MKVKLKPELGLPVMAIRPIMLCGAEDGGGWCNADGITIHFFLQCTVRSLLILQQVKIDRPILPPVALP